MNQHGSGHKVIEGEIVSQAPREKNQGVPKPDAA